MRSAKESNYFPYDGGTICYFEVDRNGNVSQVPHKNNSEYFYSVNVLFQYYKKTLLISGK